MAGSKGLSLSLMALELLERPIPWLWLKLRRSLRLEMSGKCIKNGHVMPFLKVKVVKGLVFHMKRMVNMTPRLRNGAEAPSGMDVGHRGLGPDFAKLGTEILEHPKAAVFNGF